MHTRSFPYWWKEKHLVFCTRNRYSTTQSWSQVRENRIILNPFKTSVMKKIASLMNEQVQDSLIVSIILALIVTVSVLFI